MLHTHDRLHTHARHHDSVFTTSWPDAIHSLVIYPKQDYIHLVPGTGYLRKFGTVYRSTWPEEVSSLRLAAHLRAMVNSCQMGRQLRANSLVWASLTQNNTLFVCCLVRNAMPFSAPGERERAYIWNIFRV